MLKKWQIRDKKFLTIIKEIAIIKENFLIDKNDSKIAQELNVERCTNDQRCFKKVEVKELKKLKQPNIFDV